MKDFYILLHDMGVKSANNGCQEEYLKIGDVTIHVRVNEAFAFNIRIRNGFERAELFATSEARELAAQRLVELGVQVPA